MNCYLDLPIVDKERMLLGTEDGLHIVETGRDGTYWLHYIHTLYNIPTPSNPISMLCYSTPLCVKCCTLFPLILWWLYSLNSSEIARVFGEKKPVYTVQLIPSEQLVLIVSGKQRHVRLVPYLALEGMYRTLSMIWYPVSSVESRYSASSPSLYQRTFVGN